MSCNRQGVVLISGYGKLPAHITSEEVYKTMVVAVLVDMELGTVVDAECSVVTDLAKRFVAKLLIGQNLNNGSEIILDRLEKAYFGQAKRAIESSLKMIISKYQELISPKIE